MMMTLTYLTYFGLSIGLTAWVARTLFVNGRRFLVDVFKGDTELADSVNHLLVVGFCLINLGYVSLALKLAQPVDSLTGGIEALSTKIGTVALVLGGMHFFNLYLFARIRRRTTLPEAAPPVAPVGRLFRDSEGSAPFHSGGIHA